MENIHEYIDYLVEWIKSEVTAAKLKGAIVGVSGGIDSAVVAALIKKAFPNDSMGLIIPIESSKSDVKDALEVTENINLEYQIVDLNDTYKVIRDTISNVIIETNDYDMALANTKARLRMTSIYAIAQNYGYMVIGTDNACEWFTGYFTKYGDGGVDLAPLIQLKKSEVYEIAKELGLPKSVQTKKPSAGLIDGVDDEDELKVTYQELEAYMDGKPVSEVAKNRIEYLHKVSSHKRSGIRFPKLKASDM
ncbi:NAD(+) synthase [Mycoplasma sp. P36-A1]|uniref:NAD(+) synthase n=1 Tax=Mycoplasma sp. P36-A1 TaxID=3252900 RepID=UPI003C2AC560